jgi:hypothetical protein
MKKLAAVFIMLVVALAGCGVPSVPKEEQPISEIVYKGETITAPKNYNSVPAEYKSVLDAYYLFNQISIRYENSSIGSENDQLEHEKLRVNLLKQGGLENRTIPYGEWAGYALKDINGDDVPELFLLSGKADYDSDIQHPIYGIYTIFNGKWHDVAKSQASSFYFNLVLKSDNILYNLNSAYDIGSASKLEPNSVTITWLFDYYFVPWDSEDKTINHYYKVKSGTEAIKISEEEFEKYNGTGDVVPFDFVSINQS